jgi:hypothetical protein
MVWYDLCEDLRELTANRVRKQTSRNLQHPARSKLNDLVNNLHQTKAAILAINLVTIASSYRPHMSSQ